MRLFTRLVLLALLTPTLALAQKKCKNGIPCGNTCIAANKVCRIGSPAPAPAAPTAAPATVEASASVVEENARAWVGSRIGTTYYRTGCGAANKLKQENRVYFKSEADAQADGRQRSRSRGC